MCLHNYNVLEHGISFVVILEYVIVQAYVSNHGNHGYQLVVEKYARQISMEMLSILEYLQQQCELYCNIGALF